MRRVLVPLEQVSAWPGWDTWSTCSSMDKGDFFGWKHMLVDESLLTLIL